MGTAKQRELGEESVVLKTAAGVVSALRSHYPHTEYAFMEQVANSTGFGVKGWADVVVMSLWPSRGVFISGIEVKVYRSDWVKELENGAKAENMARFCDYWYLAVGDERIVKDGELPPTWGLIVPKSQTEMRFAKPAERNPQPQFDRGFMAAILRNANKADGEQLKAEYDKGYSKGMQIKSANTPKHNGRNFDTVVSEYDRIVKVMAEFEEASGVNLRHSYDGKKIGAAVKAVIQSEGKRHIDSLRNYAENVSRLAEQITKVADDAASEELEQLQLT